jgi:sigma-54-interacting transcriptional regulator
MPVMRSLRQTRTVKVRVKMDKAGATAAPRRSEDPMPMHSDLEWQILKTARPNVLITGPTEAVEQSLAALEPYLDLPVRHFGTCDASLPPPTDVRTLVIRDVSDLSAIQQQALLTWLDQPADTRPHVVSTATRALFPLVTAGSFHDGLYYRLNTLMLEPRSQPGGFEVV